MGGGCGSGWRSRSPVFVPRKIARWYVSRALVVDGVRELDVKLVPTASIVGRLLDDRGRGVAKYEIRLGAFKGGNYPVERTVLARTNGVGFFRFPVLASGATYQAHNLFGAVIGEFKLKPGEEREVTWRLPTRGKIVVEVVDPLGRPVVADVRLGNRLRRCDSRGRVPFHRLVSGRHWFTVEPTGDGGRSFGPVERCIHLPTRTEEVVERVVVDPDLMIKGRVVDESGRGLPGIEVHADADSYWSVDARSEPDGSFELGPVAPGSHTLTTRAEGKLAPAGPVSADGGAKEVRLVMRREGRIRGSLQGLDGEIATLALFRRATRAAVEWTSSDDDRYEFAQLPAGEYDLFAEIDGRVGVTSIRVEAGGLTEAPPLKLERCGEITVRLRGLAPGAPEVEIQDAQRFSLILTIRSGGRIVHAAPFEQRLERQSVPLGPIALELSMRGGKTAKKRVDVVAGKRADVSLHMEN